MSLSPTMLGLSLPMNLTSSRLIVQLILRAEHHTRIRVRLYIVQALDGSDHPISEPYVQSAAEGLNGMGTALWMVGIQALWVVWRMGFVEK